MNFISKAAIIFSIILFESVVFTAPSHAVTKCRKEMAMMRQIQKRFGDPKGELFYAIARGPNRRSSIWQACGYTRTARSAAAARKTALKFCRNNSDSCKIIAEFRWTQKKCPSRKCYVRTLH